MKLDVTYEIRDGYLYVKAIGEFDITLAHNIFLECIERARSHGLNQFLCDITLIIGFDAQTSTITQFDIGEFVSRSIPKSFKLAILGTEQQLSKDLFLENTLVNRGVLAKVTFSMDEALEWLGITSTNKADAGDIE